MNIYEKHRKSFICANRVSKHPLEIMIMNALTSSESDEDFENKLLEGLNRLEIKDKLDE